MIGSDDEEDKDSARRVLAAFAIFGSAWLLGAVLTGMEIYLLATGGDPPGIKSATVFAFLGSSTIMLVLLMLAGDGLPGEANFLTGMFLASFTVVWCILIYLFWR